MLSYQMRQEISNRAAELERIWDLGQLAGGVLPKVLKCRRSTLTGPGAGLVARGDRLRFTGLERCHQVRACPWCALIYSMQSRADLVQALVANREAEGSAAHVVLNVDFGQIRGFVARWQALRALLRDFNGSARVKAARRGAGRFGAVRIVHPLFGANGWHIHLHFIYFFSDPLARSRATHDSSQYLDPDVQRFALRHEQFTSLKRVERAVWCDKASKRGLSAAPDLQSYSLISDSRGDYEAVASYLTKAAEEISFGRRAKCATIGRGKSPWMLLSAMAGEDAQGNLDAFSEWVGALRSFHLTSWSKGLRGRLLKASSASGDRGLG